MYGEYGVKLNGVWIEYRVSEQRARDVQRNKGGDLYVISREQVATPA